MNKEIKYIEKQIKITKIKNKNIKKKRMAHMMAKNTKLKSKYIQIINQIKYKTTKITINQIKRLNQINFQQLKK